MITYLLFGMFWVAMAIAIIYIGKAKKDYRDLAFKVDNFEDNIRDAHEKLANSISYQYFDLISKVDDLADRLVEEDVLYKRSAYVNMSDVDLANKVKIYLAFHERRASNMIVQKRFGIPYQRAIAILDLLEKNGVVGPVNGAVQRAVLITRNDLTEDEFNFNKTEDEYGGDDLYPTAKELVIRSQKASASFLQRRMGVGYARAAKLLDILEQNGVIGPSNGASPRDVYVTEEIKSEITSS
jgi:DNA segregation ATPase FtsK/SpoIIIE-like protein